ncbi:alkaline phosphatase family protein [Carboxylicivirga sp. A043]|uniref:alkaline phosphatase family protein n=1 Tax=Carboxylicivirga litoralis TaxID=2816963 RepID=UPI0021CB2BC8|nr:alkaline phosphatase family protein [Carboxylicivirga sp. A043]MCU4154808.1 alkaline phosphatase family protein [Carboxylicivirga sp. A043]
MTKKITLFLMAFLCAIQITFSQKVPSQRPKLVVFILIDQLSTDQIVAFRGQFSDNGFNRLINGGAFYRNASYPAGSAYYGTNLATIATGCYPSTHGIVSDWWYDRIRGKEVNALYGDIFLNSNENQRYPTADRILCSTITDELKWMNNGTSRVTGIALGGNHIVWCGGHSPNNLYQIDDNTGEFVLIRQSDAIKPLPEWAKKFNKKHFLNTYSKRDWGPLKDLNQYHQMKFFREQRAKSSDFMYALDKQKGNGAYIPVIHSPYGNKIVRDFAMAQIINDEYGKDEIPDVLTIGFTARAVHGDVHGAFDAETEDMILRLDLEIADLLKTIDKEVGLENTLIALTSVTAPYRPIAENSKHGIPTGVFSGQKASSLVNLFLMAKYGQGKWVMAYHDGQMYLNHELIKEKGVDLVEAKEEAARFLSDMKGVAFAMPISELKISSSDLASLRSLKLNYHPQRSGDIVVKIRPGWSEELDNGRKVNRNWNSTHLPLIFYGWKVNAKTVYRNVSMIQFAPTISSFLEIPFPNGCEGEPLQGITH